MGGRGIFHPNSDSPGPRSLGKIEDERVCRFIGNQAVGKEKILGLSLPLIIPSSLAWQCGSRSEYLSTYLSTYYGNKVTPCSVLQEQEHNQGQAVHCKRSYLLPVTKNLIVLVEAGGNWYLPILHHQISQRPRKSTAGISLFHPEASLNKPNQVLRQWPPRPPFLSTLPFG